MSDESKIEEALQRKKNIADELAELREKSIKSQEDLKIKEQELESANELLLNLRSPSNSLLKAFSRVSDKASNVIRNVRFSIMSDEELNKEYAIYKRVNEKLGKHSVTFDEFKETPEDFVEKSTKPSKLKVLEDTIQDKSSNLNTTFQEVVKNSEKTLDKANKVVDETIQKAAPTVISLTNIFGKKLSNISQRVQVIVKNTVDKYEQAEKEVAREESEKANGVESKVVPAKNTETEKKSVNTSIEVDDIKTTVKKTVVKKTPTKIEIKAKQEKINGSSRIFKDYVKNVNNNSKGNPTYSFEEYKVYVESENVDSNFILNKVSFNKAVNIMNTVKDELDKKNQDSVVVTTPVVKKRSPKA